MLLVYRPKDGLEQKFSFRADDIDSSEAELIEELPDATWLSWNEFSARFSAGTVRAVRAALWLMLRRSNPDLQFSDVSFKLSEVDVELEDDEKAEAEGSGKEDGSEPVESDTAST